MTLVAQTYHRKWPSYSKPVLVTCSDSNQWVLKGSQNQRALVNEQVVARLGKAIGAPVCEVALIELPQQLCDIEPELSEVVSGMAHGVRFIPDCSDRQAISHNGEAYNLDRFAGLQILYTWTCAGDNQLIYSFSSPHLVYSVDHGHFFPNGPNWTIDQLNSCPPVSALDSMFNACGIDSARLKAFCPILDGIDEKSLRSVVNISPNSWGINSLDREALFEFLLRRKTELVNLVKKL